jgi:plasmid replication initiation protein
MATDNQLTLPLIEPPTRDIATKGERDSMEFPMFALSKQSDSRTIEWENDHISVKIVPSKYGRATIFDKDLVLYAISQIVEDYNQRVKSAGEKDLPHNERSIVATEKVRVYTYHFLKATNRKKGGKQYELFRKALLRLQGTQIEMQKKKLPGQRGKGKLSIFSIIDTGSFEFDLEETEASTIEYVDIKINTMFMESINELNVLTYNREYFRLSRGTERRLYEIARKYCGRQKEWSIGMAKLFDKVGSASLRKFRFELRQIQGNGILDYNFAISDREIVTFYPKQSTESVDNPGENPGIEPVE